MRPPYHNVIHALQRAFSAPAPRLKTPSIWGSGPRSWEALTSTELIAIDGHVQQACIRHCTGRAVRTMRIQWEEDATIAAQAIQAHVDAVGDGLPPEMVAHWCQAWARRRLLDVPRWPYAKWAQASGIDRRVISDAHKRVRTGLSLALREGMQIMQPILLEGGLIQHPLDGLVHNQPPS